ncbi:hypothetical protein [Blastococcus montanus]|uniref:hypothetical protein n=1 Tax=Blastococcus montanus TaxID=3144973 RepID=UPI003208617D
MSKHFTAVLQAAQQKTGSLEEALRDLASDLSRLEALYAQEQSDKRSELIGAADARLADLAEVSLPAYTVPKELDDVRAAYVLQSYVNLGRPATQQEAAEIARRAGYSSGRGANIFFTHGWLTSEKDEHGAVTNRRISPAGQQWLEEKGRAALLTWLGQ